ncbi:MAG: recombinase family protein [Oscillospiraceae bacterium]|nr:recombinase family protein [Oscillospiraceae bacterium]
MEVKIIKANPALAGPEAGAAAGEKLRVCAYCRVSSDSEEQESSYAAQIEHYTHYIHANPDWAFAGIFADEGLSGTSVHRREEFHRMIAACEAGEVDMIITKSISRFARNTLDCLNYIRKLKALRIPILFEKESINTMEAMGEVLITILASIAQQESKSISDNVRMGIEFGFQEGRGILNYSNFLGFTGTGTPGELAIVPGEAELIRRIFRAYLEGFSPYRIAARLEAEGAVTARGGTRWYNSTIVSILENEKYCGELLMQKYYTEDFLTHRLVKNMGQRPKYFVAEHHDPIIPKEIFYEVQGERKRRSALKLDPSRLRYGDRLALNGRLVCGICGRTLKRYVQPDAEKTDWRCRRRAGVSKREAEACPGSRCGLRILRESEAQRIVLQAFNLLPGQYAQLLTERDKLAEELQSLDIRLRREAARKEKLEDHLSRRSSSSQDECDTAGTTELRQELEAMEMQQEEQQAKRAELAHRSVQIRLLLELAEQMLGMPQEEPVSLSPTCRDTEDFFRRTRYRVPPEVMDKDGRILRFDNDMITRYLESIIVHNEYCTVNFKAGISIKIDD